MSYYTCFFFIPKRYALIEKVNVEKYVKNALFPFNSELEFPAYQAPCPCVGYLARNAAYNAVEEQFGDSDTDERKWRWYDLVDLHVERDTPNSDCEQCLGIGTYETRKNPMGRWNRYTIVSSNGRDFNEWPNMLLVDEIHDKDIPFAILTPDGWHEAGTPLSFGKLAYENRHWTRDAHALYVKYKDHYSVVVELHI